VNRHAESGWRGTDSRGGSGRASLPLREALRLLDAEGLVLAEPHGGVRVAGVDLEGVKGIA